MARADGDTFFDDGEIAFPYSDVFHAIADHFDEDRGVWVWDEVIGEGEGIDGGFVNRGGEAGADGGLRDGQGEELFGGGEASVFGPGQVAGGDQFSDLFIGRVF